jgi:DNA-binding Lrp family transcriptional regulator
LCKNLCASALETTAAVCDKQFRRCCAAGGEAMKTFFVQIKCDLGKSYEVASALADAEIASEIYSTAGNFDLMAKFYIGDDEDVGHFVNEKVQVIPGIKDTFTTVTFRAF